MTRKTMNEGSRIIALASGLESIEEFEGKKVVFVGRLFGAPYRTEAVVSSVEIVVDEVDYVEVKLHLDSRDEHLLVQGEQTKGWALSKKFCGYPLRRGSIPIEGHFAVKN